MNSQKNNKTVALLGLLLMTFGITYFDFDLMFQKENIKPILMIFLGIISIGYGYISKKKA